MQRIYVIKGGRGRRDTRVFNIQNEVYADEVSFVPITVISQITSRRSRQMVFSRTKFLRNPSSLLVPSIPGDRKTIITRKMRGRRDPLVIQIRGYVSSPWSIPPGPLTSGDTGALYVSWPIRDQRYRGDGRRIR